MIVLWCNGSTADFGSVSQGSNPCRTTNKLINIMIEEIIVKPEDVIVLIDGTKAKGLVPKKIINDYYKNGNKLDFKSTYSIKGIIVEAHNIDEAIEQYKEIKLNLLEN